ncbi:MAG: hypothetical protein D6693_10615, partial [Planctomycetota bacterium]
MCRPADPLEAQEWALSRFNPWQVTAIDAATGERISFDDLADRAAAADVVFVGELHGQPVGLAFAAALFDAVLAREPASAALSLEFFEREDQAHLDDFLAGVTDEGALRDATGRTAGNFPPGHRAMVLAARDAGAPVIAANAPRRYVRLARTEGLDRLRDLTEAQRALVAIPESLTAGGYRDRFFEQLAGMTGHGGPDAEDQGEPESDEARAEREAEEQRLIESFYVGQNVWDATMAESIARALDAGRRPVVQVVGRFHVERDGGLAQRLRALAPGASVLTIVIVDKAPDQIEPDDLERGDVIVYV